MTPRLTPGEAGAGAFLLSGILAWFGTSPGGLAVLGLMFAGHALTQRESRVVEDGE